MKSIAKIGESQYLESTANSRIIEKHSNFPCRFYAQRYNLIMKVA